MHREAARKFGKTVDGSFVDPERVAQLSSMGIEEALAVAALRKSNNDLSGALDVYQAEPADALLGGQKKPRLEPSQDAPVDELALATLVSMSFDEAAAERALRTAGGNIDDALMALTMEQAQSPAISQSCPAVDCTKVPAASDTKMPTSDAPEAPATPLAETAAAPLAEAADAPAATPEKVELQCSRAGCTRAPWNGQPGEACCRTCPASQGDKHGKDCERKFRLRKKTSTTATEAEQKQRVLDQARDVVEHALGMCLRKSDIDDEAAGTELEEEEALLQQHLSSLF